MAKHTLNAYPTSYDANNYSYASVNSSYPLSNPVGKGSDSTTYAQWNLKTGYQAESYVFYSFDLSDIPQEATIDSVSCSAKAYISTTNSLRIYTRQMQMYYGTTTAKGSSVTVSSDASAQTISCGTWQREELNDCRIRVYTKRGISKTSTTYYNQFYGATLTVVYTVPGGEQMMIKTGGQWSPVSTVYKKVNGSWVEQTDLSTLFDTNANYVKG